MPNYVLNVFDLPDISTDDPDGFSDNGGYQFTWGVSTITIAEGAQAIPVDFIDNTDAFFDDDAGADQTINQVLTLNGVTYPVGTHLEAEYKVNLEDAFGNPYVIQFVSVGPDAYNIGGFVIQGTPPPFGVPLTVVSTQDVANGQYAYATSAAPACFALGTTVLTRAGPCRVERLRRGDMVIGPGGEARRVEMVLRCHEAITHRTRAPVRIRAGALGDGMPRRTLVLSPQHRVFLPMLVGEEAAPCLGPVKALEGLRGVGPLRVASMTWIHVVTARHGLLMAEGLPCETFWPGDEAARMLPADLLARVRQVMGSDPRPVLPLVSVAEMRRAVRGFVSGKPVLDRVSLSGHER